MGQTDLKVLSNLLLLLMCFVAICLWWALYLILAAARDDTVSGWHSMAIVLYSQTSLPTFSTLPAQKSTKRECVKILKMLPFVMPAICRTLLMLLLMPCLPWPFLHLTDPEDRAQATSELVRVLKPGGIVCIALMPVFTFLRRTEIENRFNEGYGIRPQEIAPYFAAHGLALIDLLADTGFAALYARQLTGLAETNPEAHEAAINIIISTAGNPSILGAGVHTLYVDRKNGSGSKRKL